ncbi:SLC26A11 [Lepeophtheirus salmonis]|uniref:SLC26A11 n=1 Tax=Lepeophtheirus salmonis TaxID=72036 RepID=A0A7R8CXS1_LEPSM|nr:SLC26A11 [Lepeophtheirus salmonis]CAF2964557.1 SLC26A11 [Lepeophtheirus salmonis]
MDLFLRKKASYLIISDLISLEDNRMPHSSLCVVVRNEKITTKPSIRRRIITSEGKEAANNIFHHNNKHTDMSYNEDEELTESFIADHDVVFMEGSSRENAPKQASDYFAKDQKILSSSKIGCFLHQHVASLKKELSLKRIFPALEFMSNGYGSHFAALAGLPLQYGLYSSILPGFIYAIFGHCPEISMGPTAVACILMHGYTDGDIQKSIALTFFYGGNTHIGRTIQSGISSQLCFSTGFGWFCIWDMLSSCFKSVNSNLGEIRPVDSAIGFTSIGVLLFLRAIKDIKCCQGTDKETKKYKNH